MSDESSWRVHRCPRCHEAFRRREHLTLHTGRRHGGDLDVAEADAFGKALAAEEEQLAVVRVHVKAGFAVLPVFLFFMFAVIALVEMGGTGAGFLLATIPGFVVFSVLVYAMVLSKAQYDRVEAAKRAALGAEKGSGKREEE